MKLFLLIGLITISFAGFAQQTYVTGVPVCFVREQPEVTAEIIVKLPESTKVTLLRRVDQVWSMIECEEKSIRYVGYILTHTLNEPEETAKKTDQK
jgi:hypothetical protein